MGAARWFCLAVLLAACTHDFDALDVEEPAGGASDASATTGQGNTSAASSAEGTTGSGSSGTSGSGASATTGGGGAPPGGGGSGGVGGAASTASVTSASSASSGAGGSATCAEAYPSATICTRSETQCEVIAATAVDSCSTFCTTHGAACLAAWNNHPVGSCTFSQVFDCATVGYEDLVCVCSKQ